MKDVDTTTFFLHLIMFYLYDLLCNVQFALPEEVLTDDHVELLGMLSREHTLHTHTRDVHLKVLPNKSRCPLKVFAFQG